MTLVARVLSFIGGILSFSASPGPPVGGRPCGGRYFSHVGKVTKRTLRGRPAGRTLRVLRPGLPLRTPWFYGGALYGGFFWGLPARGVGMYSPLFLLPPICRHCNRVGSTDCASCGGPYTPRWGLVLLPAAKRCPAPFRRSQEKIKFPVPNPRRPQWAGKRREIHPQSRTSRNPTSA